jgi:hypothetical protein
MRIVILRTETWIRTTPDEIARFFDGLEENYTRWHPDHHSFTWIEGRGVVEGAVCRFDETIAGKRKVRTFVYTRVADGHIEFAPTSKLVRLFLPRMLFRMGTADDGCILIQEVHVRIGPLGAYLNRKEFDAIRQHMKEEGENLKNLLENSA